MKRPAGVILTTIVLGLCAGLQLLTAAGMVFGAFAMRHLPPTPPAAVPGYPNPAMPAAGFITIFLIAYGVFLLALAAWAIATLIGLLQLKNWARYSVLVIGGCMAALSLMMVLGMVMAATMMPVTASTAQLPAHTMQAVFLFEGVIFALFAAIGVWWLIYFNLRSTKAYFVPAFPVGYEPAYVLDPATFPALPGVPPPPFYPTPAVYPPPRRFSKVPTAVIVIACLYLLSGVMTIAYIFLPFPGFVAGFILSPIASRIFFMVASLVSIALGAGLFRLENWARLGIYAWMVLGLVNMAAIMTPWGRTQFLAYNAQMFERMHMQGIGPMATTFYTGPIVVFSVVLGLLVCGVVVWILERHRDAFVKVPTSSTGTI